MLAERERLVRRHQYRAHAATNIELGMAQVNIAESELSSTFPWPDRLATNEGPDA